MNKTEIINNIEKIAITAEDEEVRLTALSILLNNHFMIEKEKEAKTEREKSEERLCNMQKALFAMTVPVQDEKH